MDEPRNQEFKALRATIRERGTVRAITFFATVVVWAALDLVAYERPMIAALAPLLVLAAGFEVIFQLHLGVERVGRYLQVAFEEPPSPGTAIAGPRWETAAMAYGRAYPTAGSDALFTNVFLLATVLNLVPPVRVLVHMWQEQAIFAAIVLAHIAFAVRIRLARQRAARQRAEDLLRFRELLARSAGR